MRSGPDKSLAGKWRLPAKNTQSPTCSRSGRHRASPSGYALRIGKGKNPVKLKPLGRRGAIRGLAVTGVALASVAGLVLSQAPAFADPGFTYVAVGSDTIQDFMNGLASQALAPGELASYNATNPQDNVQQEIITPGKAGNTSTSTITKGPVNALPAESCSFNRPNGSGQGNTSLRLSLVGTNGMPTTTLATPIVSTSSGGQAPQSNCIDISRSSSGPGTFTVNGTSKSVVDPTAGELLYVPFAVDGVTIAMGSTAASAATATTAGTSTVPDGCYNGPTNNAPSGSTPCVATAATNLTPGGAAAPQFTFAQLQTLYDNCAAVPASNGVTYFPWESTYTASNLPSGDVPVDLYIPQSGSGTLSFWESELGFAQNGASIPACDFQKIQPDAGATAAGEPVPASLAPFASASALVEEHDGSAVTLDPNGLFPFSIAQYISQSNGNNPRFHQAQLLSVDGISPLAGTGEPLNVTSAQAAGGAINLSFNKLLLREVYNIVAYDRVVPGDNNYDPTLAGLLTSTSSSNSAASFLCKQKSLIGFYGFAVITASSPSPPGLGGEAGGHYCGQIDATNLRTYGPTTGF